MTIQEQLYTALWGPKKCCGFAFTTTKETASCVIIAARYAQCVYSVIKHGRSWLVTVCGDLENLRTFYERLVQFTEFSSE